MASKALNNSILKARDGSKRSMRVVLDKVIDKAGGFPRYVKMCLEDDEVFRDAIKDRLRLEPKSLNVSGDSGLIALTLQIPRPSSEYDMLPDHVTVEAEVLPPEFTMEEQIRDKPTAIGLTAQPTDKEGSINEK